MLVRRRGLVLSCALAAVCLCTVAGVAGIAFAEECEQESDSEASEGAAVVADESSDDDEFTFQLTDYLQETPAPARPRLGEQAAPLPAQALPLTQDIFVNEELRRRLVGSERRIRYPWGTSEFVLGSESAFRVSNDLGNLLDKSLSAPAARTQPRSPNSHDPRVRGVRRPVGRVRFLLGAGSRRPGYADGQDRFPHAARHGRDQRPLHGPPGPGVAIRGFRADRVTAVRGRIPGSRQHGAGIQDERRPVVRAAKHLGRRPGLGLPRRLRASHGQRLRNRFVAIRFGRPDSGQLQFAESARGRRLRSDGHEPAGILLPAAGRDECGILVAGL